MSDNHPSEILMARFIVGKVSEQEARELDDHVRSCARCRAELDGAEAARLRCATPDFARTWPSIERRAGRPVRWLGALGVATVAVSSAVVIALVALKPPHPPVEQEPAEAVKGAGALKLYGRRDGRVFSVGSSTLLQRGDRVRFAVQSGGARYALIASIDGRGQASIYFPSTSVGRDGGAGWEFVGDSIELDDAAGPERIFAVFSDEPLEDEAVLSVLRETAAKGVDALRNTERLPLPRVQASVLFEKSTGEHP